VIDPTEDCGGCVERKGTAGANWHRRRGQPLCENAKEEQRKQSQRQRMPKWTPGSPIEVEEIEEL